MTKEKHIIQELKEQVKWLKYRMDRLEGIGQEAVSYAETWLTTKKELK